MTELIVIGHTGSANGSAEVLAVECICHMGSANGSAGVLAVNCKEN